MREECIKKNLKQHGLRREDVYDREKWQEQVKSKIANPRQPVQWHYNGCFCCCRVKFWDVSLDETAFRYFFYSIKPPVNDTVLLFNLTIKDFTRFFVHLLNITLSNLPSLHFDGFFRQRGWLVLKVFLWFGRVINTGVFKPTIWFDHLNLIPEVL